MDPQQTAIEETHLSRYMKRRRQRVRILQVAFVLISSLALVAILEVLLNPAVLDGQAPSSAPTPSPHAAR